MKVGYQFFSEYNIQTLPDSHVLRRKISDANIYFKSTWSSINVRLIYSNSITFAWLNQSIDIKLLAMNNY